MQRIQIALQAAVFVALCGVGYELHTLTVALQPLNRIPTSGLPVATETAEQRRDRIDRAARRSIQIWDDAAAQAEREKELRAEAARAKARSQAAH